MENIDWRISKYLLFAEDLYNSNKIHCVNLFNTTYFTLNRDEFKLLFKINSIKRSSKIFKKFVQLGIIVNFDERAIFTSLTKSIDYFGDIFKLSICPTLNCNFNCPYCFEKHRPGKMDMEVQNNIVNLLEKIIIEKKIKNIHITWFGGEPLLEPEIIKNLSKRIINLVDINNGKYTSNIITNGYLLNQKNADILKEAKVTNYQITLDGTKNIHDKTRCLINGNSSFDQIINNLQNINISGFIKIRQNIYNGNQENVQEFKDFFEYLKKTSKNNINYYFSEIYDNDNIQKKNLIKTISHTNYSKLKIYQEKIKIPHKKIISCGAQKLNFITIDELGNLYKCRDEVGNIEHSFGHIKNWNPMNPFYTAFNPDMITTYLNTIGATEDKECQDCIWLLVCNGGCPTQRLYYKKRCIAYKGNEEEFVLKIAKQYNNNNE